MLHQGTRKAKNSKKNSFPQESYSLEQTCGLQISPSSQDRIDMLLMHLLLPMCLRVGTGRKDVPRMRKGDVMFILSIILNSVAPLGPRQKGNSGGFGSGSSGITPSEANNTMGMGGSTTTQQQQGPILVTRTGSTSERKLKTSTSQISFLGKKLSLEERESTVERHCMESV